MSQTNTIFAEVGQRLDRRDGLPLYKQLKQLVAQMISQGRLRPGDAILPQRDLSALCQVSEVTVRRALQELAAEGLLEARAGSGTVVMDPSARNAGDKHRTRVGVVLASLTDGYPFLSRMMESAAGGAGGMSLLQFSDVSAHDTDPNAIESALPLQMLDGLVLMSPVNLALVAICQRRKLPYVLLYNDLADEMSRCIVVNYTTGMLEAVDHLVQRGRKKIALVTAAQQRFSTGQLMDAYQAALQLHHLPSRPDWVIHGGYEETQGYEATRHLLAASIRPDAIIFASDYQARGGLIAIQEAGLSAPADVAVVGAGRLLRDKEWPVPLTTIDLHFDEVGQLALRTLGDLIGQKTDVPFRQVVRSNLVVGETT